VGILILSYFVAQALHLSFIESIFLALAISITSTVITIRILEELNMVRDKSTTLILSISIVEDIIAIAALGIIESIAEQSALGLDERNGLPILPIAISIMIVTAFIGFIMILGSRFIPRIIDMAGRLNDYTLLLILILGLAFGLSFIANSVGLSVVTGAFLAGVLVAESNSSSITRVITVPLRDIFAAIFFISIGALMDISLVPFFILPALILMLTSFASKFLIVSVILIKAKHDSITALRTGLGMASVKGELSLVVAKVGQEVSGANSAIFPIVGVVTLVPAFMTPYVLRFGSRLNLMSSSSE
jgi:CPA2 family monovalent cation:H+ antiporter-2